MRPKPNRLISRAAMTLLLSVLTTVTAWAYGIAATGSCGTNASYAITGSEGNYTLTISVADPNANGGTGSTNNTAFRFNDLSGIKAVVINEGITSIGNETFYCPQYHDFTSVSIPSTVTSIGEYAFEDCSNLQTVNFAVGSQLQSIGNASFEDTGIESLVLPCPNLSSIGTAAFNVYDDGKKLSEIVCLTETSLSVGDAFYSWMDKVTVYMLGAHKVNWSYAKEVKSLVSSVVKGDGVSTMTIDDSGAEKKTVNGTTYYVGGTTVTLTLASNLSGTVAYWANGQHLPVSGGQATLTIPNDANTVTITATQIAGLTQGTGTQNDPYRISSVSDWNIFAGMINAGVEADKYYVLTNDIGTEEEPVTTMVGTMSMPFRGTLGYISEANQITITVALSSTTDNCAPFVCLDGAEIRYLTVRGTITTSAKYAASIAAHNKGNSNIYYCESYATIESTVATTSDGTHGGFVAVNESGGVLQFVESIFKGKLLGSNATSSGGFVGYNGGVTIDYRDCLFAPTEITMSASGSASFNRNGRQAFSATYPSYYTQPFGEAQGTQVYASTDDIPASCTYTTVKACDKQTYYQVTGMTIGSTADWTAFAEAVNSGNSFAGLTVKLGEDFDNTSNPVTTMVGTSTNKFSGTFDGQDRTLNVELTSEGEYTAPFRYVNGGTFSNLRTAGTVTTSHKYATGLIGSQAGSTTIQNCHSGVTIISSVNGDGTHGGFIATGGGNFQGCVFDGVICTTTEYTDTPTGTNSCGGFVGWNSASVSISNSLYAPAAIPEGMYRIGSTGSATFARGNTPSLTNSYYTEALGTAQGSPVPVPTFAPEGYATFYSSVLDVVVPEGMKARIVTGSADGGKLTYQDVADGDAEVKTVPAGTAVMLQVEAGTTAGSLGYDIGTDDRDFTTAEGNDDGWVNLLHGSDVATTTTGGAKYYKLSYNDGYTNDNKVIGWYWGADGGAAFESGANKAWLALGETLAGARFFGLPEYGETTTAVFDLNNKEEIINNKWYDLQGRCVERSMFNVPRNATLSKRERSTLQKGVYIVNGKKIVIK